MRFHGVTGAALQVLGSCDLSIRMGSVRFTTIAFVFENLAEPMLLGTNTLVTQGLVIDACNMQLYPGQPLRQLPSGAVPLFQGNGSESLHTMASWPHNTHSVAFFKHRNKLWCKDEETQEAYSLITCKKSRKTSSPSANPRMGGEERTSRSQSMEETRKPRNSP